MKHLLAVFTLLIGAALIVPFNAAKGTNTAPTLNGKWHFVLDTPGGDRELDAKLQQYGDQVTGKWGAADVKGTFTEGKLALEFPFNSDEGGAGTMTIKGTLAADALTGDWAFTGYSGSFKATRVKE